MFSRFLYSRYLRKIKSAYKKGTGRDKEKRGNGDEWNRRNVFFNGLLVVITLAVAVTGILQVINTKESSLKELRAYLSVSNLPDSIHWREYTESVIIKGVIQNLGSTPAYKVRYRAEWQIMDSAEADQIDPMTWELGERSIILGSGTRMELVAYNKNGVGDSVGRLFFYGKIAYEDIFREELRYVVFCYDFVSVPHHKFFAWHKNNDAN